MSDAGDTGGDGAAGRDDAGQVVPLAAAMLAVVLVALVALVPVGGGSPTGRGRAPRPMPRLSPGAAEGEQAARARWRAANGAELVEFERTGDEVVVRVRVGDADA